MFTHISNALQVMLFAFSSHSSDGEIDMQHEKGFCPRSCDGVALMF